VRQSGSSRSAGSGTAGASKNGQPVRGAGGRRPRRRTIFAVVPPPEDHESEEQLFVVLHSARLKAVELGAGWRVERRQV